MPLSEWANIVDHRSERLVYGHDYLECLSCHARGEQRWDGKHFIAVIAHFQGCPVLRPIVEAQ